MRWVWIENIKQVREKEQLEISIKSLFDFLNIEEGDFKVEKNDKKIIITDEFLGWKKEEDSIIIGIKGTNILTIKENNEEYMTQEFIDEGVLSNVKCFEYKKQMIISPNNIKNFEIEFYYRRRDKYQKGNTESIIFSLTINWNRNHKKRFKIYCNMETGEGEPWNKKAVYECIF